MTDVFYVADGYVEVGYVERELDASAGIVSNNSSVQVLQLLVLLLEI